MAAKGIFDTLFDKIVLLLKEKSRTAVVGEGFAVKPDMMRYDRGTDTALAAPYIGGISTDGKTAMGPIDISVDYVIPLIVKATGTVTDAAEAAAGIRMRLFKQQILEALFDTGAYDLGLPSGSLSKKEFRFDPVTFDGQRSERILAASVMTLTVGLAWTPKPQAGIKASEINVSASRWQALFKVGEK